MGQNTVLSETTRPALQSKRLAALSAQMWARVEQHLAAIQLQPGGILNELRMPLDCALRRDYEDLSRPRIFAPRR